MLNNTKGNTPTNQSKNIRKVSEEMSSDIDIKKLRVKIKERLEELRTMNFEILEEPSEQLDMLEYLSTPTPVLAKEKVNREEMKLPQAITNVAVRSPKDLYPWDATEGITQEECLADIRMVIPDGVELKASPAGIQLGNVYLGYPFNSSEFWEVRATFC